MPNLPRKPILLVSRGLDPVGTGRQIELVAAGLLAAGRDVHVAVTTTGGSLAMRLDAAGCTVHLVGRRPVVDPAAALRLATLVTRLRPAVVTAWGRSQVALLPAVRLAAPAVRLAGWLARPVRGGLCAAGLRRADRVVAASPGAAASCRRLGIAAGRIERIDPGIAPPQGTGLSRATIGAELGLDPARHWTLCVAPLEADARLDRLVWAIDQLGVVRKDLQHVLVGAGPMQRRLLRRARVQEVTDRLVVVPSCGLLPDLLGQVRLVWQSGTVALGGAVLDAMAAGVPVVAVASDAARQFVTDGETGWIAPPLPESEFPRRAFKILEDEPLAGRMATAAAARAAECFPAAVSVAAHVALHERLAS
jgi:glycosyltransferase involved in cell wall biosynthesis